MMRCNVSLSSIPRGNGCKSPGTFNSGCIYEVAWMSLALADAGTDATLKHVPRSGVQLVLDFIVDTMSPVLAATGPGVSGENIAAYLSALTVNGDSYMPKHNSSSGAAITSNKYPLAAFRREVMQRAGGVLASLENGMGTPWSQFGVHMLALGTEDDVTLTIENQCGLAADFGGTLVVYQLTGVEGMTTGSPIDDSANAQFVAGSGSPRP